MPTPPPGDRPARLVTEASGTFSLPTRGPFSLREAATFGFGSNVDPGFDGVMRLAFCLDGDHRPVAATVRQDGDTLHGISYGDADPAAIGRQVARILSVDHDGDAYVAIGERDAVVARLLAAAPGLRPPQFCSPYEALVWSIISSRRPRRQGAQLRERLGRALGTTFVLDGEETAVVPGPADLGSLDTFPGIPADRIPRLHAIGRAALAGELDVARLTALDPDAAMADLQRLPGVGPFYSALVVVRGLGLTDVLTSAETMALDLVATLYELPGSPSPEEFAEIAEVWRPYRTWVTVLIRAAAWRILPADALPERERRGRRGRTAPAPDRTA